MKLKKSKSLELLIVVNLLPLFGVKYFGWSALTVIIMYFMETFIVGFVNIFKMAHPYLRKVKTNMNRRTDTVAAQWFVILFFIFHYSIFSLGQTLFFFGIIKQGSLSSILSNFFTYDVTAELITIFLYHLYSYYKNYIGMREYKKTDLAILMFTPYKRIALQHFFAMVGGFFLLTTNSSTLLLIFFIVLKSLIDIFTHSASHSKFITYKKPE